MESLEEKERESLLLNSFAVPVPSRVGTTGRYSLTETSESRQLQHLNPNLLLFSPFSSTRGLDASTALDYAKSIRVLTNVTQTTSFVSLYQAGEGIYNQFDKVLLINEGRCVYYGPRDEARGYFISLGFKDLPRSTSGDWLCGITDPNLNPEFRFQEGRNPSNVPATPEAMEEAYQKSEIRTKMDQELQAYKAYVEKEKSIEEEFRQAVLESKIVESEGNLTSKFPSSLKFTLFGSVR